MKVDFESENDLWKVFRTTTLPDNGHELVGEQAKEFGYIRDVLYDRKSNKRPMFKLRDNNRFYYLRSRCAVAILPQSALWKVGRLMYERDKDLTVQYLGTNPEGERINDGPATQGDHEMGRGWAA